MKLHFAAVAGLLALGACAFGNAQTSPRVVNGIEWSGRGTWLKADLHTHTKLSDGGLTVEQVVAAAAGNGCDVVAITDHADGGLRAATPDYVDGIRSARSQTAGVTVITGLEWNLPPGKGLEHATVLFPGNSEDLSTLAAFKARFDDFTKEGENPSLALEGLAALTPRDRSSVAPIVIINHPSRRPHSTSAPRLTVDRLKRAAPSILVGLEGAPGHQQGVPLGSYPADVQLIDRWDPVTAEVGGAWDTWLRSGLDIWAAIANSDFHGRGDFLPCEFASTWVYAPDRSVDGVIRALRAGSFFAEHGHIVTEVELRAEFDGLNRPFVPGETVAAAAGTRVNVTLKMKVPAQDYAGHDNRIDAVELVGISSQETRVLFSGAPGSPEAFHVVVPVPAGGIVLRARGRRGSGNEQALMFYTNPIRIVAPAR